mmetsp:Transcript_21740/g.55751  ORF Transcript_21740/g.55751 Transcript_21740/m.55751 type:complete len:195 (+) Transcript_21740:264-848(+)
MGQGQSTDGQQVEPYYGVVISPELLEQLDGQPRRKKGAEQAAPRHRPPLGLRPDPFSRGGGGTGGQRVTLIESTRKGDLLLKHEQQEAQMIEQAAADMIKKYYRCGWWRQAEVPVSIHICVSVKSEIYIQRGREGKRERESQASEDLRYPAFFSLEIYRSVPGICRPSQAVSLIQLVERSWGRCSECARQVWPE